MSTNGFRSACLQHLQHASYMNLFPANRFPLWLPVLQYIARYKLRSNLGPECRALRWWLGMFSCTISHGGGREGGGTLIFIPEEVNLINYLITKQRTQYKGFSFLTYIPWSDTLSINISNILHQIWGKSGGADEESNHTTARKPCFLEIIQYSLVYPFVEFLPQAWFATELLAKFVTPCLQFISHTE